jgi:hypothetical protein
MEGEAQQPPRGPAVRLVGGPEGERWAFDVRLLPTFHRDTQQWVRLARRVDRRENVYHEVVWNSASGEIFHDNREPLRDHRDRGDARRP